MLNNEKNGTTSNEERRRDKMKYMERINRILDMLDGEEVFSMWLFMSAYTGNGGEVEQK